MSANPHLWSSIQVALDDAEWFVLLASPEAAGSEWVGRELGHWLATKSPDRILVVLTDGTLEWDGRELSGSAVPPALRDAFSDEPRHVDLRWAASETDLDMHNARFRDVAAQLAAPMHGIAKDELDSEDVRQHRHARRLARGGVTALTLLVVVALAFGAIAAVERNNAQDQRKRANEKAVVATAERFAALASSRSGSTVDQALILAVEGYRRHADSTTRAALLRALTSSQQLVGFVPGPHDATTSAIAPDASLVVTGTSAGSVRFWDVTKTAQPSQLVEPPSALTNDPIVDMTFDSTGKHLYTLHDDGRVEAWDTATRSPRGAPMNVGAQGALNIALNRDDRTIAVAGLDSSPGSHPGAETVALYDVTTRHLLVQIPGGIDATFSADGRTLYAWQRFSGLHAFDVRTGAETGSVFSLGDQAAVLAGVSDPKAQSLLVVAMAKGGCNSCGASVIDAATHRVLTEVAHDIVVTTVAMNHDGSLIAIGGGDGSLTFWGPANTIPGATSYSGAAQELYPPVHQSGQISAVSIAADGLHVVSTAADGTTALWDLSGAGALATAPVSLAACPACSYYGITSTALSPTGTRVATVGLDHRARGLDLRSWSVPASSVDRTGPPSPESSQSITSNLGVGSPLLQYDTSGKRLAFQDRGLFNAQPGAPETIADGARTAGPAVLRGKVVAGETNLSPFVLVVPAGNAPAPDADEWRVGRVSAVDIWTGRTVGSFDPSTITSVLRHAHRGTGRDASTRDLAPPTDANVEPVKLGFAVDAQGKRAATISNQGDVVVWDLSSGRVVGAPIIAAGRSAPPASALAFSPSGTELAVGRADGTIARYSLPSLHPVGFVVEGNTSAIGQLAYQPHGTLLAASSAAEDDLVDTRSGERVAIQSSVSANDLPGSLINAAASAYGLVQFDRSGQHLMTVGPASSRPVLVWSLHPADWVGAACRAAGRNLSRAEWSQLVGSELPYHETCPQWPRSTA